MRKTDLAWAAGFFDGEGCVHLKRDYNGKQKQLKLIPTYSLRLMITNTHLASLERVREILNIGSLRPLAHYGEGPEGKQRWEWRAASKQAESVLRLLMPYLTTKREQATLAILSRKYQQRVGAMKLNPNLNKIEDIRVEISGLNQGRIH